jgi:hypothetical protein
MRNDFMKQNGNFENSQELKGSSEKFKNQLFRATVFLTIGLN